MEGFREVEVEEEASITAGTAAAAVLVVVGL